MTLEDLMYVTNDNAIVEIYADTELIARYDGKDSIPEEYNDCEVYDVYANGNVLCVEIDGTIPCVEFE